MKSSLSMTIWYIPKLNKIVLIDYHYQEWKQIDFTDGELRWPGVNDAITDSWVWLGDF